MAEQDTEWKMRGQFEYNGYVWADFSPIETLEEVVRFPLYDDDVIIATYPKMGTTLAQETVFLIMNDADIEKAKSKPVFERVPFMEETSGYKGMDTIQEMPRPRLIKSHLPFHMMPNDMTEKQPRVLHVSRNPKDTLVSYFHFYRASYSLNYFSKPWHDFFELHQKRRLYSGDIFDHVLGWWNNRDKINSLFIFYEDMVKKPHESIKKIAKFLGKHLDDDVIEKIANHTSFKNMKDNPSVNYKNVDLIDATISPFMRKGVIGDWKNHFSEDENMEFDKIIQEKFVAGASLTYEYE